MLTLYFNNKKEFNSYKEKVEKKFLKIHPMTSQPSDPLETIIGLREVEEILVKRTL